MQIFPSFRVWPRIGLFPCIRLLTLGIGVLITCMLALVSGPAAAGTSAWEWPLSAPPPPAVLNPFDPPSAPWERGHRGIDLDASPGETVLAAGAGRVLYAGMLAGRGVVSIVHGTLRTTYEPVVPTVHAGEIIAAGDRIGVVGEAPGHCMPRSCLHWGLLRADEYLHPLRLLGLGPIRLLPVWETPAPYGCAAPGCVDRVPRGVYAQLPSRAGVGLAVGGT